ncbi:MAG: ABC transporter ATP-binding protein [Candidatus Peribacteraceae bacterium]|nr:ABC transporter ATP-binding protein [Candidatus Peribacteraceae bacterium]
MSSRERSNVGKILFLLKGINIHPLYLLIPITLSLASAAFEGIGMGLLIPILNGFFEQSFAFVTETPYLREFIFLLPDSVIADDRQLFGVLLGGFVIIYILKNLLRYFAIVSIGFFSERSLHHLRKIVFSKYVSFGKLFFDTTNVGHHSTLLLEFTRQALNPLLSVDRYINSMFSLIVYFVIMMMISWKLTLIALPLFIILHFAVRFMVLKIRHLSRSIASKGAALGTKSVEILSTIPLVKSYRTEVEELKRYSCISDEKAKLDFRTRCLHAVILPMQEVITMLFAAGIFLGALYFFGREQIASAPALVVYFYVVVNASSKFGAVSGFRGTMAAASGPLEEVLEIFSEDGKYFVKGGDVTFKGLKNSIECKNLTFSYTNERDVLKGVSFTIEKGKMTAIVGPTGSGKSTLINLFMRYYDCPENSIFVDGTDVREFALDSYLRHIALVSQDTMLLHDSLRYNIAYGLGDVSDDAVLEAVERARLLELVSKLPDGLDTLIGDRGVKLSGGEKQRVSIARALLKGAEILILDEATSSLDSKTERLIQEAIDEAVKDRTAIVIAHRLSTIQHADSIVVIEDGKLVEKGVLDDLLRQKGVFSDLWEEQKF